MTLLDESMEVGADHANQTTNVFDENLEFATQTITRTKKKSRLTKTFIPGF